MLTVGSNLLELTKQNKICDHILIEEFSLKIRLGRQYYEPKSDLFKPIVYGSHPDPTDLFHEKSTITQNLLLKSGARVIGCSHDRYRIPLDYFGLVQTKGTLARMFVQVTCNDGQIEPGFDGFITLEIVNLSPWTIELPKSSEIGQLFLFKTSTPTRNGYSGRYAEGAKEGPTLPIFL